MGSIHETFPRSVQVGSTNSENLTWTLLGDYDTSESRNFFLQWESMGVNDFSLSGIGGFLGINTYLRIDLNRIPYTEKEE